MRAISTAQAPVSASNGSWKAAPNGVHAAMAVAAPQVSLELDVRGQLPEEALDNVDKYLDDCMMAGVSEVSIVHGKGTGALRKAVHEMLKRNKAVKSFRLGRYGEGEAGVTVVELK